MCIIAAPEGLKRVDRFPSRRTGILRRAGRASERSRLYRSGSRRRGRSDLRHEIKQTVPSFPTVKNPLQSALRRIFLNSAFRWHWKRDGFDDQKANSAACGGLLRRRGASRPPALFWTTAGGRRGGHRPDFYSSGRAGRSADRAPVRPSLSGNARVRRRRWRNWLKVWSRTLIVLTGDPIDRHETFDRKELAEAAERLAAIAPPATLWRGIMSSARVRSMNGNDPDGKRRNRAGRRVGRLYLGRGGAPAGRGLTHGKPDALLERDGCRVVLFHYPENFPDYAGAGYDLVLSGRARRSGSIFGHGLLSPREGTVPRYTSGLYRKKIRRWWSPRPAQRLDAASCRKRAPPAAGGAGSAPKG